MKKILVAPTCFKGTLTAIEAAACLGKALSDYSTHLLPLADGGDDTLAVLQHTGLGFEIVTAEVTGPLVEQKVQAQYLIHHEKQEKHLAVIEAALAHGILRLPPSLGNIHEALKATSYGVGELILHAVKRLKTFSGKKELIITLGGSASTDGGLGALHAMGANLYGDGGQPLLLPATACDLMEVKQIKFSQEALSGISISIATDVTNPLLGANGTARIYAPQKGATPDEVASLEVGLSYLSHLFEKTFGSSHKDLPGAGAAGGLGFGLSYLKKSTIISGFDWLADLLDLQKHVDEADVIITGEGRLDRQSLSGKVVGKLIAMAGEKPVIIFCGQCEKNLPLPANVHVFALAGDNHDAIETTKHPQEALAQKLQEALVLLK